MPNSVWYNNINRVKQTVQAIESHSSEIVLCSREKQSYEIANKYFPMVKNYLVPDVVLAWNIDKYLLQNNIHV
jgi:DNA phosphorothioation-dependent restriction protein DptG